MNLRELNRATLARQALLERQKETPVAMVERLLGMQAQEPRPPFTGLWTRIDGFEADHLRQALGSGEIVRATLMRATLHLMSARDYSALRSALQPALDAAMSGILKARGEGIVVEEVLPVARKLLKKGPRTFDEIRDHLQDSFPDVDHRALGYVTRTGLPLVMVPTDDPWAFPRDAQFALADEPAAEPATQELVRRYLAAFGPATAADFQTWSGLKGASAVFKELRPELDVVEGPDGRDLFDLPGAPRPDADVDAPARFLPAFDNLVLSHKDRTRVIAEEHRPRLLATGNLRVRPSFLVDGFVSGMWSIERKRKSATLTLEPFGKLTRKDRAELAEEGERLLRFSEPDSETYAVEFESPS